MFKVNILNKPVTIKTVKLMEQLNLPLYAFLDWLNLKSTKQDHLVYSEFKNVVLPILKRNSIVRYVNSGHTIVKIKKVPKSLILLDPYSKSVSHYSYKDKVYVPSKNNDIIEERDYWVNDYCDDSWSHKDCLL